MSGVSCATVESPKAGRVFSGSEERFLSYQTAGKREYKTGGSGWRRPVRIPFESK